MPSLADIANSILNTLNSIKSNTGNTETAVLQVKADTAALNMKADKIIAINETGFYSLSQGTADLISQAVAANQQLQHLGRQNEIVICWLNTAADLLCKILRQLEASHEVQAEIRECLAILEAILELVHGCETVAVKEHRAIVARMDTCCPKPSPDPEPCFKPCPRPPKSPGIPGSDYEPLPKPEQKPD